MFSLLIIPILLEHSLKLSSVFFKELFLAGVFLFGLRHVKTRVLKSQVRI